MSVESVKKFFEDNNLPLKVEETIGDTATVKSAAETWGIEEDEIAKTMGYKLKVESIFLFFLKELLVLITKNSKASLKKKQL